MVRINNRFGWQNRHVMFTGIARGCTWPAAENVGVRTIRSLATHILPCVGKVFDCANTLQPTPNIYTLFCWRTRVGQWHPDKMPMIVVQDKLMVSITTGSHRSDGLITSSAGPDDNAQPICEGHTQSRATGSPRGDPVGLTIATWPQHYVVRSRIRVKVDATLSAGCSDRVALPLGDV